MEENKHSTAASTASRSSYFMEPPVFKFPTLLPSRAFVEATPESTSIPAEEWSPDELEVISTLANFPKLHKHQEELQERSRRRRDRARLRHLQRIQEKQNELKNTSQKRRKVEISMDNKAMHKSMHKLNTPRIENEVKLFIDHDYLPSNFVKKETRKGRKDGEKKEKDTSCYAEDDPEVRTFTEKLLEGHFTYKFCVEMFS